MMSNPNRDGAIAAFAIGFVEQLTNVFQHRLLLTESDAKG
jgi:hypothetical protein